jgi:hypothetical protein
MIYLTAVGLTADGSSTHLHTNNTWNNTIDTKQYIEQHNSLIRKSAGRAPSLRGVPWHLRYTEEKARKNLSQGKQQNMHN